MLARVSSSISAEEYQHFMETSEIDDVLTATSSFPCTFQFLWFPILLSFLKVLTNCKFPRFRSLWVDCFVKFLEKLPTVWAEFDWKTSVAVLERLSDKLLIFVEFEQIIKVYVRWFLLNFPIQWCWHDSNWNSHSFAQLLFNFSVFNFSIIQ